MLLIVASGARVEVESGTEGHDEQMVTAHHQHPMRSATPLAGAATVSRPSVSCRTAAGAIAAGCTDRLDPTELQRRMHPSRLQLTHLSERETGDCTTRLVAANECAHRHAPTRTR
jgi:hypothetical protein